MILIESMMKLLLHQIQLHKLPEAFYNLRGMQFNGGFTKLIAMMMEPPYE
jgi:hypothetical protein